MKHSATGGRTSYYFNADFDQGTFYNRHMRYQAHVRWVRQAGQTSSASSTTRDD